jgi:hypothetical protein
VRAAQAASQFTCAEPNLTQIIGHSLTIFSLRFPDPVAPDPLRMVAADANFAVSSSYFPRNLTLSAFGKKQNDDPLSVINVKSQLSITASTTRPNPDLKSPNPVKAIQISDVDDFLLRYAAIPCACECGRIWRAP